MAANLTHESEVETKITKAKKERKQRKVSLSENLDKLCTVLLEDTSEEEGVTTADKIVAQG